MTLIRTNRHGSELGIRLPTTTRPWTAPVRGVRSRDESLSHAVTARGVLMLRPEDVACDLTAAHMWDMVLPSGFGLDCDGQAVAVATSRGRNRTRAAATRGRRLELPAEHVTVRDGVRVTSPARTWLDCASLVSWTDTVAMGDGVLRAGLASLEELDRIVAWGRARRGIVQARRALGIVTPDARSPGESWVRAMLHRSGLPRPACNLEVLVDGCRYVLDLAWAEARIAVEYDGEEFHGPAAADRDRARRDHLEDAGWRIFVVRRSDLGDVPALAGVIAEAMTTRGFAVRLRRRWER